MSGIRLSKVDAASIVTPPADTATIFVNAADGEPSYKDDAGVVTSLQGVIGPQGDAGEGVPVGGTTGQLLAKIDGTDFNTEWVDPGAPVAHAASHQSGGGDEIDVTGLSGVLADPQTPILPIAQSDVTDLVTDLAAKASAADLSTEISDRTSGDSALDSRLDALEAATTPPESQGTWLASGGAVAFLQDYDFTVSGATYYINGTQYTAPQTNITLDAADVTNDRFDAIAVNTSGAIVAITGTPAANPALPDINPETQLALTYILVQAGSTAAPITQTNIYLENTEWTSSVSGGTINAASTSNPFAGTTDIEATASAAGHYVRLTNGAPISLADKSQLVLNIRSKAAWPNPKSLQLTWYNSGVKIGQSVALSNNKYGFLTATTGVYQQVVIPIAGFAVPSSSTVDRLEFLVSGSGSTIGFYLDNIILETGSSDVTPPSVGAATASTLGLVRTDVTDANPQVYLRTSMDTALALKASLSGATFSGDITVPADAYDATTWNGNNEVPTKNDIRDKIEALGSGGATDLDGLSDVTITSPTSGDLLRNNGSGQFVNTPLVAGDIPNLAASKITSGVLAVARLATGTPDGTKFVRDDGTLAVPPGGSGTFDLPTFEKAQGSPTTQDENFNTTLPARFVAINSGPSGFDVNSSVPGAYSAILNAGGTSDWKGHVEPLPSGDGVYAIDLTIYCRQNGPRAGLILADGSTAGAGNQMWFNLIKVSGAWDMYVQQGVNYAAPGTVLSGPHGAVQDGPRARIILRAERSGTTWTLRWRDPETASIDNVTVTQATLGFTPTFIGFGGFDNVATYAMAYAVHTVHSSATPSAVFGGVVSV